MGIANASQPHTLPSPTSQRKSQSLSKSVSVPTHGRQKRCSKLKDKMAEKINTERLTRGIVNCRCSAYSSGTARIKSSCNMIGKCFEIGN